MANFRNTNDLKKLVLQYAGELTDGNSPYDTVAISYLNALYQGLLAGGNEFDIEVAEPWVWARARNPIVLTLKAPYATGTVSMTNGSRNLTFSNAPLDVLGWLLKVDGASDYYYIRSHSGTAASLDQEWLGSTGSFNFKAIKLDYDLYDNSIAVDDFNRFLPFKEGGGALAATLTKGVYSPAQLATEIQTRLNAAGTLTYTVSFDSVSRLFTLAASGNFQLLFASGTNANYAISRSIGFSCLDLSGAATYTASNAVNAIQRLVAPFTMYRQSSLEVRAPEDDGKIYGISYEAFLLKYPVVQLVEGVPDRFCELEERDNGTKVVRFSMYPSEDMRVEVDYIPIDADLQDNICSVPKVPRSFREYLVYGATYKLMLDKSDNKAQSYLALAQAKLQALIHHNRSSVEQTAKNYGRLVPRPYTYRRLRIDP